jgi:hypothetical protein
MYDNDTSHIGLNRMRLVPMKDKDMDVENLDEFQFHEGGESEDEDKKQ